MPDTPLAYLITFRCYGTWLHGDERGSSDRLRNQYGSPFIEPNDRWSTYNQRKLKHAPVNMDEAQRRSVELAIRDTCRFRKWNMQAINVRTDHVHVLVSTNSGSSELKLPTQRQPRAAQSVPSPVGDGSVSGSKLSGHDTAMPAPSLAEDAPISRIVPPKRIELTTYPQPRAAQSVPSPVGDGSVGGSKLSGHDTAVPAAVEDGLLPRVIAPEPIINAFKANATRQMRQDGNWTHQHSPWSDGGSRRYIWTEVGIERAIDYVINGQGGTIPELDERMRPRGTADKPIAYRRWY